MTNSWSISGNPCSNSAGLDPTGNAYREAGRCFSIGMGATFGMYILAVLVLGAAQATRAQNACPVNKQVPENKNKELNVPQYKSYFYRPRVKGDYIVIEYNASQDPKKNPESNKVTWTDYSHLFEPKEDSVGRILDQLGIEKDLTQLVGTPTQT